MAKFWRFLFLAGLIMGLAACSHGDAKALADASMPEEVYAATDQNYYRNAKVGVFPFTSPAYARGTGNNAASILCRQLEKNRVFSKVFLEPDTDPAEIFNIARAKRYDLVITGSILYWFDGSTMEPSRVEQEIVVTKPSGKEQKILWKARLMETGWPVQPKDFILVQKPGAPAPSAMALVQKNSGKFCKLLLAGR
ncbi:MAG: hypothetical protein JEZ02_05695 [Desulfatibacillum sp.]|nr:hypothetical protein [Desulfatibacillum sp.]